MTFSARILAASMFIAGTAHAAAMDDFKAFLTGTQSARADFAQTVYDVKGKMTQQAKGTLVFVRPGKFRWTYIKPAQSIVGDGAKVSFFDEDLNQVTVRKLEKAFAV